MARKSDLHMLHQTGDESCVLFFQTTELATTVAEFTAMHSANVQTPIWRELKGTVVNGAKINTNARMFVRGTRGYVGSIGRVLKRPSGFWGKHMLELPKSSYVELQGAVTFYEDRLDDTMRNMCPRKR